MRERADASGGGFLANVVMIGGTAFVADGIAVARLATGAKAMSDNTYAD